MNNVVRSTLAVAMLLGTCLPLRGQGPFEQGPYRPFQFMLPVEFTQGVITDRGSPHPYTLAFRAYPQVVLESHGRWRIGGSAALNYRNPEWEVLGGGRISYRVITWGVDENGVDLALEGLLGADGGDEIALASVVDLARLFRIGVRAGRDVSRAQYRFEMSVGTDPLALVPLLSGKRIEDDFEQ